VSNAGRILKEQTGEVKTQEGVAGRHKITGRMPFLSPNQQWWISNDLDGPLPGFQGHIIYEVEYLKNDAS